MYKTLTLYNFFYIHEFIFEKHLSSTKTAHVSGLSCLRELLIPLKSSGLEKLTVSIHKAILINLVRIY